MGQTCHTHLLKLLCMVLQRAWTVSDLFGTICRTLLKKHNRANFFVELLLRPKCILLNVLPVVGAFAAFPLAGRHDAPFFVVVPLPYSLRRFVQTRVTPSSLLVKK